MTGRDDKHPEPAFRVGIAGAGAMGSLFGAPLHAVTGLQVGTDSTFTATGTFGEPNNVGETFSLTGAC